MNTGQVLLVLGALCLLSVETLSVNSLLIDKTTTMMQSEAQLAATSIAQSMMDEILTCSFDSAALTKRVWSASGMTPTGRFGPEAINVFSPIPENPDTSTAYKSLSKYDDVDDYNNYRRYVYSTSLGTFSVTDTVYYVTEDNAMTQSTTQTFYKKIIVTVRHRNLCTLDGMESYDPWRSRYFIQLTDVAVYRRYF